MPDPKLTAAIEEAWRVYLIGDTRKSPAAFVAKRLAGRVVWRDNLQQVGWVSRDGTLFALDDDPENHAADCADPFLTVVWRLVGEERT